MNYFEILYFVSNECLVRGFMFFSPVGPFDRGSINMLRAFLTLSTLLLHAFASYSPRSIIKSYVSELSEHIMTTPNPSLTCRLLIFLYENPNRYSITGLSESFPIIPMYAEKYEELIDEACFALLKTAILAKNDCRRDYLREAVEQLLAYSIEHPSTPIVLKKRQRPTYKYVQLYCQNAELMRSAAILGTNRKGKPFTVQQGATAKINTAPRFKPSQKSAFKRCYKTYQSERVEDPLSY